MGARGASGPPALGFVDPQRAAVHRLPIEGADGVLGSFGGVNGDESESFRAPRLAVRHETDAGDGGVGSEEFLDVLFGGAVGQVADVNVQSGLQWWVG